jgi:hypothetical protein
LGSDELYYLNHTKAEAVYNKSDILAIDLLNAVGGVTWERVASAVPPIRKAGVRAFVGSRGSVADTTFNDAGEDAAGYGFPPALSFVMNLTNIAEGGSPILDGAKFVNSSLMAEGVVGGHLPNVVFYFPIIPGAIEASWSLANLFSASALPRFPLPPEGGHWKSVLEHGRYSRPRHEGLKRTDRHVSISTDSMQGPRHGAAMSDDRKPPVLGHLLVDKSASWWAD